MCKKAESRGSGLSPIVFDHHFLNQWYEFSSIISSRDLLFCTHFFGFQSNDPQIDYVNL
jgi:hypothetical protein